MIPTDHSQYICSIGDLHKNDGILLSSTIDDINQVFYADGPSEPCTTATNLSVRYVTQDEFHELITGESSSSFEPKTLYVISSDQINAFNTNIINVADPKEYTHAANKQYVDQQDESLKTEIAGDLTDIKDILSSSLSSISKYGDSNAIPFNVMASALYSLATKLNQIA